MLMIIWCVVSVYSRWLLHHMDRINHLAELFLSECELGIFENNQERDESTLKPSTAAAVEFRIADGADSEHSLLDEGNCVLNWQ